MRRLLRRRWLVVLLIWTALIAVPVVQLWPAANTPLSPCNYQGSGIQDPALPTCPPDNANYEAIGMSLLILLWLAGVTIGLVAVGITRLVRWRKQRAPHARATLLSASDEPLDVSGSEASTGYHT